MDHECGGEENFHHKISALFEFSAKDDVIAFKDAVEKEGCDVDEIGFWYGRSIGSNKMSYEERTPLMIASLFGSKGVVSYILGTDRVDVNRACGSDRATALHCAVYGCSADSVKVIQLLLDASADINSVDANGNRPSDLIVYMSNSKFGSRNMTLQALLDDVDVREACLKKTGFQMGKQQGVDPPQIKKKYYPSDLSLPDLNNEIYSTDEFRMFSFKVKPCLRSYPHEWTECPFVHPKESARRRDPRKYYYTCFPCPEYQKGSCSKGDACEYAHGIFECRLHPAQYRTKLCSHKVGCTRKVCFFAHKPEELRPVYASTGSGLPLPTSNSSGVSPIYPFTVSSASALQSAWKPPLTPSVASSHAAGTEWLTHAAVPTFQMPRSSFKTALNARGNTELLQLENLFMWNLMIEEMASLSSPSNRLAGGNPTNFEGIFRSQIPSLTSMQVHQNRNQQLWGYPADLINSNVIGSPQLRVDPSLYPRYDAFSKRGQRVSSFNSELPSTSSVAMELPTTFPGWGSPDGKLDWTISNDELNKMRKSYSSFQN
ncbi:zinc finger CCCH domain-containing protein 66-like [Vicia villosa]|uniref:zinc finger CCCH domain-containing protein 66-like n=1 Tax=Vicia villosa TaxID=3911 RepID=UPI00273C91CB|nr:zinc finger CCCH domain-containing protein 66-like [Vicia villosa]